MRLVHAADLHLCKAHADEALVSLAIMREAVLEERADLVVLAGDLWDGPIMATAGSRYPEFIQALKELSDAAPVACIYGTPSHDTDGSLEVLRHLKGGHGITILEPGQAYGLYGGHVVNMGTPGTGSLGEPSCILLGIPEPSRKWLLADGSFEGEAGIAMREAMRRLCGAYAGVRARHAKVPAILVAHGQVAGSRLSNGSLSGPGGCLAMDDLAAVGADYVALGDIHEPQRIGERDAWYAGSIYPCDWGERHECGCNLVTFEGRALASVRRIPFGHPVQEHVKVDFAQALQVPAVPGRKVWWEVSCSVAEAALLDVRELQARLVGHGAHADSRVTLAVQPYETVRAHVIGEADGLEEKLERWGEASGIEITEAVREKTAVLARTLSGDRQAAGARRSFRIESLRLRGATGLWKRSGLEDAYLDLRGYGDGVITLAGENGAGKTTILENLHPWPCLLTREGPLRAHFRRADSLRELVLRDTVSGMRYRSLISLDGSGHSEAASYYLYREEEGRWVPLPGINGRLSAYEAAVEELFGSLSLFVRTAFVAQKRTRSYPELPEATKGERKRILIELAGIGYLQGYADSAKTNADAAMQELEAVERRMEAFEDLDARIGEADAEIRKEEEAIAAAEDAAREASERLADALQKARGAEDASETAGRKHRERETLDCELALVTDGIRAALDRIERYDHVIEAAGSTGAALAEAEHLEADLELLEADREAFLDAEGARTQAARQEAMERMNRRAKLQRSLDQARRALSACERETARLGAVLHEHLSTLCPTCGQELDDQKMREIAHERERRLARYEAARTAEEAARAEAENLEAAVETVPEPAAPLSREYPREDARKAILARLKELDLPRVRASAKELDTAAGAIAQAHEQLSALRTQETEVLRRLDAYEQIPDLAQLAAHKTMAWALHAASLEALHGIETGMEVARARLEQARRQRALLSEQEIRLKELRAQKTRLASEEADWRLIARAFGPDGIQALALDACAPEIAVVANRLLAEAGIQGSISFRTTRLGGKGAKARQIEDFLIMYAGPGGEEQELSTLSGGEATWVRKAVYDAFAVTRERNSGIGFQTVFLDESDGALDGVARMRYFRMVRAAHREASRYQTIIITHSEALQDMADFSIRVADLRGGGEAA